MTMTQAHLVLADGTTYTGTAFGATGTSVGEVVFNTGMTGYQEILTDPSYAGQLVALTYPIIGNYGVTPDDFESLRTFRSPGSSSKNWPMRPSNWRSQGTLDGFLREHGVVGIAGLDTRALTQRLRSVGVMMGALSSEKTPDELKAMLAASAGYEAVDYAALVTTKEPYVWPSATGETLYKIALLDCGVKFNILRSLAALGVEVTVFPAHTPAEAILATNPDGIFLSPGPGDPALLGDIVQAVRVCCPTPSRRWGSAWATSFSAAPSADTPSRCRSAIAGLTIPSRTWRRAAWSSRPRTTATPWRPTVSTTRTWRSGRSTSTTARWKACGTRRCRSSRSSTTRRRRPARPTAGATSRGS